MLRQLKQLVKFDCNKNKQFLDLATKPTKHKQPNNRPEIFTALKLVTSRLIEQETAGKLNSLKTKVAPGVVYGKSI